MEITWQRLGKGRYLNASTGVEIRYGWDRLSTWSSSAQGWFVYSPRAYTDFLEPSGFELTLHEAKARPGAEAVESMATALAAPGGYAWAQWRERLETYA